MYLCQKLDMRNFTFLLFVLTSFYGWSQTLVINELDANDPSTDDEEFIELKSLTPNFSTDGYILVFFNGNNTSAGNDLSYLAFDLNGYTTDSNGLLVLGNLNVSPFPQVLLTNGLFQNGTDAVAIYQTSIDNFPDGTPATSNTSFNLVDALVYDTGSVSAVDNDLLMALGQTTQYFEGSDTTNSLQRRADNTFEPDTPTPRALNDGSGIIFNAIAISTTETQYIEGESFQITFTADQNVTSDVTFNISLSNGTFTTGDFSGSTSITIPNGQNTASTFISLLDDPNDEGDEELVIEFLDLVEPIVASNNFITVRVVDNDFTTAAWGTPLNPTYDQVTSTQPVSYYSSLNGKSGQDLRDAVQVIIADPNEVRTHSYADVFNILKIADQNPENSNQVWLVYTEEGRSKLDQQNSGISTGKWNREHTFPRSRGGFNDWDDFDDEATGINVFITTNADSLRHANSDAHALRAADASENSRRSNANYSNNFSTTSGLREYNGPANVDPANGIGISFRGDVARSVLFLDLRYNGLDVVSGFPNSNDSNDDGTLGNLDVLLQWHEDDTPDDYEMNRNNVVYEWQRNRNPLIDLPDLVDYIWGDKVGQVYNGALSVEETETNRFSFYPNPSEGKIIFQGIEANTKIEVLSIEGRKIQDLNIDSSNTVDLNLSKGIYLIKFYDDTKTETKRLVIK
ncbi:Por secretion system C-terminal sorting domain-containing protein [Winogradskyella jejuensis]|uniref:Por secretion system C-terminal sorting domain-containing protein n=2 Tax=Winogradskyella jejuensis TaxID=1089305 RepID=A0A1M5S1D0_9FLAO|nr:Por secretion system C-terminal sorting domain-containing protein [Winogradskyella jejuensis]